MPFLASEHQQQVAQAVERAKQVTMPELNAIIGVSFHTHETVFLDTYNVFLFRILFGFRCYRFYLPTFLYHKL